MSYQKFIGVGNATRSPELRYTQSGTAIANVGLAFNRRYKQGDELKEEVCFLDATVWGKRGESFAQMVDKGKAVLVEGYIKQERWETDDGQKRSKHVLVVETYRMIGKKEQGDEHGHGEESPEYGG